MATNMLKTLKSDQTLHLVGRRQHVRTPATFSSPTVIECGVAQGSVLGPNLLLLYIADLQLLIEDRAWSVSASFRRRHSDLLVLLTNAVLVHGTIQSRILSVLMSFPVGCDHT